MRDNKMHVCNASVDAFQKWMFQQLESLLIDNWVIAAVIIHRLFVFYKKNIMGVLRSQVRTVESCDKVFFPLLKKTPLIGNKKPVVLYNLSVIKFYLLKVHVMEWFYLFSIRINIFLVFFFIIAKLMQIFIEEKVLEILI